MSNRGGPDSPEPTSRLKRMLRGNRELGNDPDLRWRRGDRYGGMNLLGSHLQHGRQLELLRLDDARRLRDKRVERLRSHLRIVVEGAMLVSESCRAAGAQEQINVVAARVKEYGDTLRAERAAMALDSSTSELTGPFKTLIDAAFEALQLRQGGADIEAPEVQEKLKVVDMATAELGDRSRKLIEGVDKPI
jgi:hypothetical protein